MMTLDSELLRTLVAVADSGGFARAGQRRHLSQSTVSQQMKRLEAQAGRPLFVAAGRRRLLSEPGERLLGYARRILALNDAAELALRDGDAGGTVRVGATQDFAESHLPSALRSFSRRNARVRLEVKVGKSQEIRALMDSAELDLAIVLDDPAGEVGTTLACERACWIAANDFAPPPAGEPWPLALFDAPCVFRDAALRALDSRHIPWRIAYSSPSLAGLLAAVRAGVAVTARLQRGIRAGMRRLGAADRLPPLGSFRVALLGSPGSSSRTVAALASALRKQARAA